MTDEAPRSRMARVAAEAALVRVLHHYGERPEFVVLGGLVPVGRINLKVPGPDPGGCSPGMF